MKAEIITIGDEILIGQTIDTNSAWMGSELNKRGVAVYQISTITDEREHILTALDEAAGRADLILITGGLGPTQDDVTKATLCEYFDTTLELDDEVLERVREFFLAINRPMMDVHIFQAHMPKSATVLPNKKGTASGMWFEKNGKIFVSMPGVPYEMMGIMEDEVFARIEEYFELPTRAQRTIMTIGVGESILAQRLTDTETRLRAAGAKLAYLPSFGMVRLRVSFSGSDEEGVKSEVKKWSDEVENMVKEYVFGYDDEPMAAIVGRLMSDRSETISVAESCTGGNLSHELTSVSGSSRYFIGSIVSYDNSIKVNELNVNPAHIAKHGAVSQQVVEQMAKAVRVKYGTTYALSTSGIAGPTGATPNKPVGTVWVGLATPEGVKSRQFLFGKNRQRNIDLTTLQALDMLRREILK